MMIKMSDYEWYHMFASINKDKKEAGLCESIHSLEDVAHYESVIWCLVDHDGNESKRIAEAIKTIAQFRGFKV